MKPFLILTLGLAILRLPADEPATPAATPAETAATLPAPAVVPAPPPAAAETVSAPLAGVEVLPTALTFEPTRETPPEGPGLGEATATQSDLQFSEGLLNGPVVELDVPRPGTNVVRIQGIGPRAVKPSRFGSFFQLFNPFAPATETMEAQPVSWYDGQLNVAPLPRALRDEKTETPVGGVVVSVGR